MSTNQTRNHTRLLFTTWNFYSYAGRTGSEKIKSEDGREEMMEAKGDWLYLDSEPMRRWRAAAPGRQPRPETPCASSSARRLRSASIKLRRRRKVRLEQADSLQTESTKPFRKSKSLVSSKWILDFQFILKSGNQRARAPRTNKTHQCRTLETDMMLVKWWENLDQKAALVWSTAQIIHTVQPAPILVVLGWKWSQSEPHSETDQH